MRKCNKCGRTWVSQSRKCIDCGSEDIIWEYIEEKTEPEEVQEK